MYHLTEDQYRCMFLAAANLRSSVHESDPTSYGHYELQLRNYTAMLTGSYPSEESVAKAIALAKTFFYEDHREDINKIIEVFIGSSFEYEFTPPTEEEKKAFAQQMVKQALSHQ